jgi:YHS domain-containing protein
VKGPEAYLKMLALKFNDPVETKHAAMVDSTLRAWVGIDVFYFASRTTRDRFEKDPLRYCHAITDPVTRVRFRATAKSPHLDYAGRHYYFAADSTRTAFNAMPMHWAKRGPADEMKEMKR